MSQYGQASAEWSRAYQRESSRKRRAGLPNVAPIDDDLLQLEWRDIPNHPGYMATRCGKIMSVKRRLVRCDGKSHTVPARIIKPRCSSKKKDRHQYVGLYVNKKRQFRAIARLIYSTWRGPIPAGMDIDHIDEVANNNHVDNLQPLTPRENVTKNKKYQAVVRAAKRQVK